MRCEWILECYGIKDCCFCYCHRFYALANVYFPKCVALGAVQRSHGCALGRTKKRICAVRFTYVRKICIALTAFFIVFSFIGIVTM